MSKGKITKQAQSYLKDLYLKVHPDLFAHNQDARNVNQSSLAALNQLTSSLFTTDKISPTTLIFHLKDRIIDSKVDLYSIPDIPAIKPVLCAPLLMRKMADGEKQFVKFLLATRSIYSLLIKAGVEVEVKHLKEIDDNIRDLIGAYSKNQDNHEYQQTEEFKFHKLFQRNVKAVDECISLPEIFYDKKLRQVERVLALERWKISNISDPGVPVMFSDNYKIINGLMVIPWNFKERECKQYINNNVVKCRKLFHDEI